MTPADIRRIRHKLGLTQAELADRLGVDERSFRRWETDTDRATHRPINATAAILLRVIAAQHQGK